MYLKNQGLTKTETQTARYALGICTLLLNYPAITMHPALRVRKIEFLNYLREEFDFDLSDPLNLGFPHFARHILVALPLQRLGRNG